MKFDHEKLNVYQVSLEFVGFIGKLVGSLKREFRHARDQIIRSSQSIPLNIAEGNGKRSHLDRKRFFEIARGSAMESAATLDVLVVLGACSEKDIEAGKTLLVRIVSMLSKMTEDRGVAREEAGAYGASESVGEEIDYDYEHEHEHERRDEHEHERRDEHEHERRDEHEHERGDGRESGTGGAHEKSRGLGSEADYDYDYEHEHERRDEDGHERRGGKGRKVEAAR